MIIKTFVVFSSIAVIDESFVISLPQAIRDNAKELNTNPKKQLKLGVDHNTTRRIIKMLRDPRRYDKYTEKVDCLFISQMIGNLLVNTICFVLINVQIIFLNYFSPFIGIFIQYTGYYL